MRRTAPQLRPLSTGVQRTDLIVTSLFPMSERKTSSVAPLMIEFEHSESFLPPRSSGNAAKMSLSR